MRNGFGTGHLGDFDQPLDLGVTVSLGDEFGHAFVALAIGVLADAEGARAAEGVASTIVHFADVSDAEIDAYVATGEPLWVAGAFTVDGLGGPFVAGIEGDHHNVVGLSLPLLRTLLLELGVDWTSLWQPTPADATPVTDRVG